MRVWLWFVYKFTENYCHFRLFPEFIQTQKSLGYLSWQYTYPNLKTTCEVTIFIVNQTPRGITRRKIYPICRCDFNFSYKKQYGWYFVTFYIKIFRKLTTWFVAKLLPSTCMDLGLVYFDLTLSFSIVVLYILLSEVNRTTIAILRLHSLWMKNKKSNKKLNKKLNNKITSQRHFPTISY